jgi:receptor protein-tyrosine kinase
VDGDDVELREVAAALRAAWWLPVVGALMGAAAGLLYSLAQTPLYATSTQLWVSTDDTGTTAEAFQGSLFAQDRINSYAVLLGGDQTRALVSDRLGIAPSELSSGIEATVVTGTVFLDVRVTDPSAERAQQVAEAIGAEFPALVEELETPIDGGASPVKITVTDAPELPAAPSSPETMRNAALGVVLGTLLGGALAILRRRLDRSVRDPDTVPELTGAAVIGTVLRDPALVEGHVIAQGESRAAEDYRQLRTNLQFLDVDRPPRVIMVSSAVPAEGKTTLVVNLGLALADAGQRVAIAEADLRRPKVTRYLGMIGGVGLTNVLAGTAELGEVTQPHGSGKLSVVASGPTPPNPGELLGSSQMAALLDTLRSQNDFVLVDAPPLLPVADAAGLAPLVDGVLLSVHYGSTTKEELRQAALTLERVGARLLGVVLNIVPPRTELGAAYGYGYSYGAESSPPAGGRRRRHRAAARRAASRSADGAREAS